MYGSALGHVDYVNNAFAMTFMVMQNILLISFIGSNELKTLYTSINGHLNYNYVIYYYYCLHAVQYLY